jgi:hypothetical protein
MKIKKRGKIKGSTYEKEIKVIPSVFFSSLSQSLSLYTQSP